MPSTPDFAEMFDGCRGFADTGELYKKLFVEYGADADRGVLESLMEAHRRADERLTTGEREITNRSVGENQVHSRVLRNWCRAKGIPLAKKGRVPITIENEYREAHGLPPAELPQRITVTSRRAAMAVAVADVPPSVIRSWAREQGIDVGARGRVHPDIIARFIEAHPVQEG